MPLWESWVKFNPSLSLGKTVLRAGAATPTPRRATLAVVIASPAVILTTARRVTAKVTSTAWRAAAPLPVGRSRPSAPTESLRGSYAISVTPITTSIRHRGLAPRLLGRRIRIVCSGRGGLRGWGGPRIATCHALD